MFYPVIFDIKTFIGPQSPKTMVQNLQSHHLLRPYILQPIRENHVPLPPAKTRPNSPKIRCLNHHRRRLRFPPVAHLTQNHYFLPLKSHPPSSRRHRSNSRSYSWPRQFRKRNVQWLFLEDLGAWLPNGMG